MELNFVFFSGTFPQISYSYACSFLYFRFRCSSNSLPVNAILFSRFVYADKSSMLRLSRTILSLVYW